MKITKLETIGNEFVTFTRITTEDGAQGWGQLSTYNADITAEMDEPALPRRAGCQRRGGGGCRGSKHVGKFFFFSQFMVVAAIFVVGHVVFVLAVVVVLGGHF
jgi:hypothetical protein